MDQPNKHKPNGPRVSRRIFLGGVAGLGAAAGLARTGQSVLRPQPASAATTAGAAGAGPAGLSAAGATAPTGPPTTTLPLPTTTAPEQLLLTWGADPATVGHRVLVGAGHGAAARPDAGLLDPADHRGQPRPHGQAARRRSRST